MDIVSVQILIFKLMQKEVKQLRPIFCLLIILAITCASCKKEPLIPKPIGYHKIDLPERTGYSDFTMDECNFTFKYPDYVYVEQDTLFFDQKPEDPCWLNVRYPSLNGMVHMSYKSLKSNDLNQLTEDYHRLKNKHVVKADYIDDAVILDSQKKLYGLVSQVGGNVASAYQFYLTDSSTNYVRGSLYFRAQPNADSLKPAVDFVREDLVEMLASWEWNDN